MGQALYRKYRSKSLDDVVGQEHITDTLRAAIKSGRISHAYLFTGPRGVGKTSIARILAHELNQVAYNGEDSQLDIIEIDAASNGGVDEVRDLRDKVYIAPTNGKYKVYIIDEVHMMTTSAFNALLKTLEEPPAHAIFILATTEAHKLPATIISRTQRFTFKPIARDKMLAHLKTIAKAEKISIDDDALELIATQSEGSFRDAIGMLDQVAASKVSVDRATVETLLGLPNEQIIDELLNDLAAHDIAGLAAHLGTVRSQGVQATALAKLLGSRLRQDLVNQTLQLAPERALQLLAALIEVPASHNAEQRLELALFDAAYDQSTPALATVHDQPVRPPSDGESQPHKLQHVPRVTEAAPVAETSVAETSPLSDAVIDMAVWQALLEKLKKQYNTLYGVVRMARPEFTPGQVTLTFGFIFHQKRVNDTKNKKIITAMLEDITGQRLSVLSKYDKDTTPVVVPADTPELPAAPAMGAISAVFGGGEVLKPGSS